jgi:hypothetical protein
MSLFVKYLAPLIRNYPQITLSRLVEQKVQKLSMEHLGSKNMGELRDRFEGQSFLNKAINRVSSYIVTCDYLQIDKLTVSEVFKNPDLNLNYKGSPLDIVVFEFGNLPEVQLFDIGKIFLIKKDNQTYSVCGIASTSVLSDKSNFSSEKGKGYFIGFDKLEL